MTRLSGPSLVFLSSLSPPFPSLYQLKIAVPLSYYQTDGTSKTFESQFMELTFPLIDNSVKFVCVPSACVKLLLLLPQRISAFVYRRNKKSYFFSPTMC